MNDLSNRGPLGLKGDKPPKSPARGLPPVSAKKREYRNSEAGREEAAYNAWLHNDVGICGLTGRTDIENAHTGTLREGKGMSIKAAVWTILPLSRPLHHYEERNRATFWPRAGFPGDTRFDWSIRLFDIFKAKDDPMPLLLDMREKADRDFLETILRKG